MGNRHGLRPSSGLEKTITFTTRVVTSSGSDTYATIAAAMSSLKGPRHGGANIKVIEMMDNIRANISDWKDDAEVRNYLEKILQGDAFDRDGLIYGFGHAVYSISDPRERIFKAFVSQLAAEKGMLDELGLYEKVEKLAPELPQSGISTRASARMWTSTADSSTGCSAYLWNCIRRSLRLRGLQAGVRTAWKSLSVWEKSYVPLMCRLWKNSNHRLVPNQPCCEKESPGMQSRMPGVLLYIIRNCSAPQAPGILCISPCDR